MRLGLYGALPLLFALACGGGTESPAGQPSGVAALPAPLKLPYSVKQTSTAIRSALGDRNGAAATLLASDKGYSIQQISSAGVEKRLTAQGQVQTASGGIEPPAGRPLNKFASNRQPSEAAPDAARLRALVLDLLGDILNDIGSPSLVKVAKPVPPPAGLPQDDLALGDELTTVTVALLAMGYDTGQIAEAVVFGDYVHVGWGVYIIAADRVFVCPKLATGCNESATSGALDAFLPGGLPSANLPAPSPQSSPTGRPLTQLSVTLVWTSRSTVRAGSEQAGSPRPMNVSIFASSRDREDRIRETVPGGSRDVGIESTQAGCEADPGAGDSLTVTAAALKAADAAYSAEYFIWARVSSLCSLLGDAVAQPKIDWQVTLTSPDGRSQTCAGSFIYIAPPAGPTGEIAAAVNFTAGTITCRN